MNSRVLVICSRRYNQHQLWGALNVMLERGHSSEVVSTDYIIQDEESLSPNRISRTLDDLKDLQALTESFDALMVISGNHYDTESYWSDKRALAIVDAFAALERPIAAICAAVPTIRGAAAGKIVSYFPLIRSRQLLQDARAILSGSVLTRDHNIVTAANEMMTEIWAEEFCNLLEGLPQEHHFEDSGFVPKGRPRKPMPELERLKRSKTDKH